MGSASLGTSSSQPCVQVRPGREERLRNHEKSLDGPKLIIYGVVINEVDYRIIINIFQNFGKKLKFSVVYAFLLDLVFSCKASQTSWG